MSYYTEIRAFLEARLQEREAALKEYVERRYNAVASDPYSHSFATVSVLQQALGSTWHPVRGPLNSYEYDATIWLSGSILADRMMLATTAEMREQDSRGLSLYADRIEHVMATAYMHHRDYRMEWKP